MKTSQKRFNTHILLCWCKKEKIQAFNSQWGHEDGKTLKCDSCGWNAEDWIVRPYRSSVIKTDDGHKSDEKKIDLNGVSNRSQR